MALKDLSNAAQKWVKALRSGEFKQTKGRLTHAGRYCCLGVACEISGVPRNEWNKEKSLEDRTIRTSLRLEDKIGSFDMGSFKKFPNAGSLAELNDNYKVPFKEIGDFIASNPPGLFIEKVNLL